LGWARIGADKESAAARAAAIKGARGAKVGSELRKELQGLPQVKDFQNIAVAYDKVKRAGSVPSAAGDLSLIFGFMKLLDPGSTVREGEFATAQNAGGIDARLIGQYNKILSGERLAPEVRKDFLGQSENLYATHETQYRNLARQYRTLAEQAGVDPSEVVLDLAGDGPAPSAAPDAAGRTEVERIQMPDGKTVILYDDGSEDEV
jgi:hypothetical protein